MKVYISGPITGVEDFKKRFAEAEKYLAGVGYSVLNPAAFNSVLPRGG